MKKVTLTNVLALLSATLGAASAIAASLGGRSLAVALIGIAVVTLSLLVLNAARDVRKAQRELNARLTSEIKSLARAASSSVEGSRKALRQAGRAESQVASNLKRLIGDVSALRLEIADAAKSTSDDSAS